jgi:hypothetical protein
LLLLLLVVVMLVGVDAAERMQRDLPTPDVARLPLASAATPPHQNASSPVTKDSCLAEGPLRLLLLAAVVVPLLLLLLLSLLLLLPLLWMYMRAAKGFAAGCQSRSTTAPAQLAITGRQLSSTWGCRQAGSGCSARRCTRRSTPGCTTIRADGGVSAL